jgi:hypothetical protein
MHKGKQFIVFPAGNGATGTLSQFLAYAVPD